MQAGVEEREAGLSGEVAGSTKTPSASFTTLALWSIARTGARLDLNRRQPSIIDHLDRHQQYPQGDWKNAGRTVKKDSQ